MGLLCLYSTGFGFGLDWIWSGRMGFKLGGWHGIELTRIELMTVDEIRLYVSYLTFGPFLSFLNSLLF